MEEFSLRHVKWQMPIRRSRGNVKWAARQTGLEFRSYLEIGFDGKRYLEGISIWMHATHIYIFSCLSSTIVLWDSFYNLTFVGHLWRSKEVMRLLQGHTGCAEHRQVSNSVLKPNCLLPLSITCYLLSLPGEGHRGEVNWVGVCNLAVASWIAHL